MGTTKELLLGQPTWKQRKTQVLALCAERGVSPGALVQAASDLDRELHLAFSDMLASEITDWKEWGHRTNDERERATVLAQEVADAQLIIPRVRGHIV